MTAGMLLLQIIQGSLYLALAPLVIGLLRWAKARLQSRQGPAWYQPYRDLFKLLGKRPVVPVSANWVFGAAPAVVFACYAALGFLAPVSYLPEQPTSWTGDLLLLVYLLGLARLVMGLAGMSTGAPLGGLGSSRELFLHVVTEPTLFVLAGALSLKWHTTDLSSLIWAYRGSQWLEAYAYPSSWFVFLALALVTLNEAGRLPFDNPATHLELTMFGKAIHLEYAGPSLALLEWAEALRLTFLLLLLSNLALPRFLVVAGAGLGTNALLALSWFAKLIVLVLLLAVWETLQLKVRLRAILAPAATPLVMTLVAAMLAVIERHLP
jgi:formate hydrogenlyase subunit 4